MLQDATNEDDATPVGLALAHPACLALLRNAAVDDVGALAKLRAESQAEAEIDGAESHFEEVEQTHPKIRYAAVVYHPLLCLQIYCVTLIVLTDSVRPCTSSLSDEASNVLQIHSSNDAECSASLL